MSQVNTGVRSILSAPNVYELFQKLMGADAGRKRFVREYVDGRKVKDVLDIGCGPAELLEYMHGVDYFGFDISETYIEHAKKKFGERGKFFAKKITFDDLGALPKFDLVIMQGLLHHIDDAAAIDVLTIAREALKPGGRLITADGCLVDGQNPIARYLIKHDRGQNIKTEEGYRDLASRVFEDVKAEIYHRAWIPYTLCFLECRRGGD